MEKRHCPYLGIIDDPITHISIPNGGNACHRAKKPVNVALEYQETHCLCDAYQECPGYTKGWQDGFPLELRADYDPTTKNIFKKIQFWKEEQQKKLSQKKELKEQREKKDQQDWKERLQSKFQFKKEGPSNQQEKILLDEEPVSEKEDITQETKLDSAIEPQEQLPEKTILHDEAALKEYLRTKRKSKNPLLRMFSRNKETKQKELEKEFLQGNQVHGKEEKTKHDWKKALLSIIPVSIISWIKKPQKEEVENNRIQIEQEIKKESKQKKGLKEVLQNIFTRKKEKRLKPERKKAIQDELTSREKEQIIDPNSELVRAEETSIEELQPLEEEQEILPNVWVKEEEQFIEDSKEISQEEMPQWEKQIEKDREERSREEILPDVMAWRDRQISKQTKKEGILSKLLGKKKEKKVKEPKERIPQDVMAMRDRKRDNTAWKKVFTDKRVWLVSLGIILIFLLVIFIPQLPSVNLNIRDRLDGLFNPPISTTTATIVNTSTSIPEEATQTEVIPSATTEATTEAPVNTPTEQNTPTSTSTATITPTSIPSSTPTPGPPPFIYLTPETPEP